MKDLRIVIAGSRSFNNNHYLEIMKPKLLQFINNIQKDFNPIIISGTASGADQSGERFANEFNIPLEKYPADWDKHGKKAGYIRNEQMAEIGDVIIIFWDGVSKGSQHMINITKEKKKLLKIIRF